MADQEGQTATLSVESEGVSSTPTQATVQTPQGAEQPQVTEHTQVGGNENQTPSSKTSDRPKPSEYYFARKREQGRISNLEKQIANLTEIIQKSGSQQTKPSEAVTPSNDELLKQYLNDPIGFQQKMMQTELQRLRAEIREKDFPGLLENYRSVSEKERNELEALEMLFPKDNSNPNDPLEARMLKNAERTDRIKEILSRPSLAKLSVSDPKEAAELALLLYDKEVAARKQPVNPAAPKKAHLASTVTGNPSGHQGGAKKMTLEEIRAEDSKLNQMLDNDPNLRHDDTFIAKKQAIKEQLLNRAKELSAQ